MYAFNVVRLIMYCERYGPSRLKTTADGRVVISRRRVGTLDRRLGHRPLLLGAHADGTH
jgi:hypothetical protein